MKIKNLMTAAILTLLCSAAAFAQETLRVGDEVEFSCTRVSSGVCGGRVEAVNGNSVRVKWGNMRDQFTMVSRDQIRSRRYSGLLFRELCVWSVASLTCRMATRLIWI